jgi:putative peptidoglycan lipid II flippase
MIFRKQESYKRGIIASTLLNIGSRSIGFVNSLLLVYLFGTNTGTDSYFLVISTLGFLSSFLIGIINYVVIPESMRIRQNMGTTAEQSYINFFFWLFLALGLLLLVLVLCSPVFFYSLFSKFTEADLSQYHILLTFSCLLFPLNLLINLLVLILSSHKYFTAPMIVAMINSIVSIALLFVLKAYYGVTAAVIAFIAGSLVNMIWVTYYLVKHLHWNFFRVTMPARTNWRNILLIEINLIPVSFRSYITIYMLSGLGAGIITSYNYGMQIALIPEIMVVSQVSAVLAIKYNELSATDDKGSIDKLFQKAMKLLFFALFPVGILIFLLSPEILRVLFIFKNKEEMKSIMLIAGFMSCFALTLPFRALDVMVANIMMAQQKIKQGVAFSVVLNISIIVLTIIAVKFFRLTGFYYLTVFVYIILIPVFYYFFARKVLPFIQIKMWARNTMAYFFLLGAAAGGLFLLKRHFLVNTNMWITILIISSLLAGAVLLINAVVKYTKYSLEF